MTDRTPCRRLPWLALAAMFGALFVADGASAACNKAPKAGMCGGCCSEQPAAEGPAQAAEVPASRVLRPIEMVGPAGCPAYCFCRSQHPDAPQPRPGQHSTAGRRATAPAASTCPADLSYMLRAPGFPIPPPDPPPATTPVYLSTLRLLI
jgi:hypothetical protein